MFNQSCIALCRAKAGSLRCHSGRLRAGLLGLFLLCCPALHATPADRRASFRLQSGRADKVSKQTISPQDQRRLAQIKILSRRIERLENQLADEQDALGKLKDGLPEPLRSSIETVKPKVAVVLNINGAAIVLNAGKAGFRPNDRVVFITRAGGKLTVHGFGIIDRVYNDDAEGGSTIGVVWPEDEIYVISRSSSP